MIKILIYLSDSFNPLIAYTQGFDGNNG
jgi:hypothetical protein